MIQITLKCLTSPLLYWIPHSVSFLLCPSSPLFAFPRNYGAIWTCVQSVAISLTLCYFWARFLAIFFSPSLLPFWNFNNVVLSRLYSQICPCIMTESVSALASGVPMETGSHCILGNYGNQQKQIENRALSSFLMSKRCEYPLQWI